LTGRLKNRGGMKKGEMKEREGKLSWARGKRFQRRRAEDSTQKSAAFGVEIRFRALDAEEETKGKGTWASRGEGNDRPGEKSGPRSGGKAKKGEEETKGLIPRGSWGGGKNGNARRLCRDDIRLLNGGGSRRG